MSSSISSTVSTCSGSPPLYVHAANLSYIHAANPTGESNASQARALRSGPQPVLVGLSEKP
ncbi:hypothetical protein ACFZAR_30765 [Streptomyces sp. NPDC008222]|uniref:hypothetical protein n=1 Tax=Streptomyces sp. NPDC008222 TaxID=3364820 RepID=UPI0036E832A4